LLSDLARKSVEPIALACGTAVRTLQEFLTTADWQQQRARTKLQTRLAEALDQLPEDPLGTVGVIDETSCVKKGIRPRVCSASTWAVWARSTTAS
jgi:hypothetical protein